MAPQVDIGDLEAQLKLNMDRTGVQSINQSFAGVKASLDAAQRTLDDIAGKSIGALNNGARAAAAGFAAVGRTVNDVGNGLSNAITRLDQMTSSIRGKLVQAQNEYTQAVGRSEQAANDLADAQYRVQAANISIGRQVTQTQVPGMRLLAAAAQDVASIMQKNPLIAQVMGGIGAVSDANQAAGGGVKGGLAGLGVGLLGATGAAYSATAGQSGIAGSIHSAIQDSASSLADAIKGTLPSMAEAIKGAVGRGSGPGGAAAQPLTNADNSPAKGAIFQAQVQANRQIEDQEIQLGRQRVQFAILAGRVLVLFAVQQARQVQDLNIQQGRQAQDFDLQQGRQRVDMAKNFGRQQNADELNFARQRQIENRDFQRQQIIEIRDYNRQLAREKRDFGIQSEREQVAYDYQQHREAVQFQLEQANAAHQFQVQEQRNAEDHQFRLLDLAATRDALGIYKENRAFNVQKARDQEDFNYQKFLAVQQRTITLADEKYQYELSRKYRQEDFKRQLADQAQNLKWQQEQQADDFKYRQRQEADAFAFQRSQQALQYVYQLMDMNTAADRFKEDQNRNYDRQREDMNRAAARFAEDLVRNYTNQLDDLDRNQVYFREDLQRSYTRQVFDLDHHLTYTEDQYTKFYRSTSHQMDVWVGDMQATLAGATAKAAYEENLTNQDRALIGLPPLNGKALAHAAGGYSNYGDVQGEAGEEFVLSNRNTRRAESILGGRMSQEAMLSSMTRGAAGGGGGGAVQLTQNFTFHGSFTEGDKRWFEQAAREQATSALTTAVRNVTQSRRT